MLSKITKKTCLKKVKHELQLGICTNYNIDKMLVLFRAGDRITLTDTSDADWWYGTYCGYSGCFPSRYVLALIPGQVIYRVVKPLQLKDAINSEARLLRDQVK